MFNSVKNERLQGVRIQGGYSTMVHPLRCIVVIIKQIAKLYLTLTTTSDIIILTVSRTPLCALSKNQQQNKGTCNRKCSATKHRKDKNK